MFVRMLYSCVFLCAAVLVRGQPLLHGVVYGEDPDGTQRPLPGARLQWLGSSVGTVTAADGQFRLVRPPNVDTLRVSAVGYRSLDTVLPAQGVDTLTFVLVSVYALSEVRVEAAAPTITAAPVKTEAISARQLEQSACCSLAESFEKSPTVEASFSDPLVGTRQIQMLGLSGVYVQTLVEAVPTMRGLALPVQWEYIPGPFLESIAISKGAASVVDGYEGLTGTIAVSYRKPYSDVPFFANSYASTAGRFELNLTSARLLGPHWYGMGFLHGSWTGLERDANGDGFIDMPLRRQLNAMAWVTHLGGPETFELHILAKGVVQERHGGTLSSIEPERAYRIEIREHRGELIAKGTQRLSDVTQIGLRGTLVLQQLGAELGLRQYRGDEAFGALKMFGMSEWARAQVRYGVDLLTDFYDEHLADEHLADTAWRRREIVPGAFVELTLQPLSAVTLVTGLRGDWHNLYGAFLTPRAYLKWQPVPLLTLRLSAGRGMRVPNVVADNLPFFLSARRVLFGPIGPEWGWNYGGSLTLLVPVAGLWTLDLEAFRTEFRHQVVPDLDASARLLLLRDVGRAYANSVLVQAEGKLADVELRLAYRWWDTWAPTGGRWQRRPLISPHRLLATLSYATAQRQWQLDATLVWNSGGRLPSTADNPDSLRWGERFPAVFRLNGQLTRRFGTWELYVGVENATNALQRAAILDARNPRGPYFDASLIWGPLEARLFYLGLRWRVGEALAP